MSGEVADAELLKDLAEVGWTLGALELFLKRPVLVVADEDAEAVALEGHGQAVALRDQAEQVREPCRSLRGPEVEGEDGPRGVIDGAEEEDAGAPAEPVELAAVDEHESAHGRPVRAAGAVLARAAAALGGRPRARRSRRTEARLIGRPSRWRSFSVAAVIEVGVSSLQELCDAISELDVQRPRRGPTRRPWTKPRTPFAR